MTNNSSDLAFLVLVFTPAICLSAAVVGEKRGTPIFVRIGIPALIFLAVFYGIGLAFLCLFMTLITYWSEQRFPVMVRIIHALQCGRLTDANLRRLIESGVVGATLADKSAAVIVEVQSSSWCSVAEKTRMLARLMTHKKQD